MITQICHPVLAIIRTLSKFKKAVLLSKMIFFFFFFFFFLLLEKAGARHQYVCNNIEKFQIDCLKTIGGVDYTNYF